MSTEFDFKENQIFKYVMDCLMDVAVSASEAVMPLAPAGFGFGLKGFISGYGNSMTQPFGINVSLAW